MYDNSGATASIPSEDSEGFEYTFIPVNPESKNPALPKGFEYSDFKYGQDYRNGDERQAGHVTTEEAQLAVADVDDKHDFEFKVNGVVEASAPNPYPFHETALGKLLIGYFDAEVCAPQYIRADGEPKCHLYMGTWNLGMEEYPAQWATHEWAYDIKSNGFVRAEPAYVNTEDTPVWHPTRQQWREINAAIEADKAEYKRIWNEMLDAAGIRRQGQGGATDGDWRDDDFRITSRNDIFGPVARMVTAELTDEEITARLEVIMPNREAEWPERQDFIDEAIDSARKKKAAGKLPESAYEKQRVWIAGSMDDPDEYESWEALKVAEAQERQKKTEAWNKVLPVTEHWDDDELGTEIVSTNAGDGPEAADVVNDDTDAEDEVLSLRMATDQGLAEQILRTARSKYRPLSDTGRWLVNRSGKWEVFPGDPCMAIIAEVARTLPKPVDAKYDVTQPLKADDPEFELKKLRATLLGKSGSSNVAAKMKAIAFSSKYAVREDELDADAASLWAGGHRYNLRTLEATGTSDDIPHLLTTAYTPVLGRTPLWDAFNEAQFASEELREYAQYVMGSALLGGSGKLLPNFKSDRDMGKTTRIEMLVDLFGLYSEQLPNQLLSSQQGHDEVYLRLKGKRLVWSDETPPSGKIAREKLKALAGGGSFTGRGIRAAASVTFRSQHTLLMAGNDDLPLDDPAVVSRVRYLPITGTREAIAVVAKQIWASPGVFSDAWKAEAPAVLWKLMQRASAVANNPSLTDMPAEALADFAEAVQEQDVAARFVNEYCQPGGETRAGALYEEFVSWCKRNDIRTVPSSTKFGRRLTEMGYPVRNDGRYNYRPLSAQSLAQTHRAA